MTHRSSSPRTGASTLAPLQLGMGCSNGSSPAARSAATTSARAALPPGVPVARPAHRSEQSARTTSYMVEDVITARSPRRLDLLLDGMRSPLAAPLASSGRDGALASVFARSTPGKVNINTMDRHRKDLIAKCQF